MIHLEENLYLDADNYQFILREKKQPKEEGKEPYFSTAGHYPTIAALLKELTDRKVREGVKRGASLRAIQRDLEEWAKGLKSPLTEDLRKAVAALEQENRDDP